MGYSSLESYYVDTSFVIKYQLQMHSVRSEILVETIGRKIFAPLGATLINYAV